MLCDASKRQFAPQAHQCLLRVRQQMPIGHLQFLIQGEKTRLHTVGRSHTCAPLPPAGLRASASAAAPVRGPAAADRTARTSGPGSPHSPLRRWLVPPAQSSGHAGAPSARPPLVRSRPASLSDAWLSTGRRRQTRLLLARSSSVASLLASSRDLLLFGSWHNSFPLASLPPLGSPLTLSKQTAQNNASHPNPSHARNNAFHPSH